MKLSIRMLIVAFCMALLIPVSHGQEPTTPEAAAQNPSLLASLLKGQDAEAATEIVTKTVNAAKALGLPADATTEMLAMISAAAIAAGGAETGPAIATALMLAAGPEYQPSVAAAIVLAAGTEPWAGAVAATTLNATDAEGRGAVEAAMKDPVKTLGEELASKVVQLSARVRKTLAKDAPSEVGEETGAANAGQNEMPVFAVNPEERGAINLPPPPRSP